MPLRVEMSFPEQLGAVLIMGSLGMAALALIDPTWGIKITNEGTIYEVRIEYALLEQITYTGNGTIIKEPPTPGHKTPGQMAALGILVALGCLAYSTLNVFLVATGARDLKPGHLAATQFAVLGGLALMFSAWAFRGFWGDDEFDLFTIHPLHLGDSYMAVLVAAQLAMFGSLAVYFSHSALSDSLS